MPSIRSSVGYARRLLTRCRVEKPPVDVENMARGLGIDIQFQDFPDEVSGALFRGPDRVVIAANANHHRNRRRFTVAHELGHHLLHPDSPAYYDREHQIGMYLRAKVSGTQWDSKEVEANRFAAELLMPRRLLLEAIKREGDVDADSLARLFEVSQQAMTYRLAEIRFG